MHKDHRAGPEISVEIYASRRRKSGCGTRQAQVEKVLENSRARRDANVIIYWKSDAGSRRYLRPRSLDSSVV